MRTFIPTGRPASPRITTKMLAVIQAVEACATENEAAYICSTAVRFIECHRVLKPTGSIYVHCDDHANSYLRILLDAIFGAENFRNELNWNRSGGKSDAKKWGRVSDHLLYYTKSRRFTWNRQYQPHNPDYVKRTYRYDDDNGRGPYRKLPLHAAGTRNGESGAPWGGYDPGARGNHWRTPTQGIMSAYIREHDLIPGWPDAYPGVHERLEALDDAGLIAWSRNGVPEIKTYLSATNGIAATDFIADIPMSSRQRGYGLLYPETAGTLRAHHQSQQQPPATWCWTYSPAAPPPLLPRNGWAASGLPATWPTAVGRCSNAVST